MEYRYSKLALDCNALTPIMLTQMQNQERDKIKFLGHFKRTTHRDPLTPRNKSLFAG